MTPPFTEAKRTEARTAEAKYLTDGDSLFFHGDALGLLSAFAFGGPDLASRQRLARQSVRHALGGIEFELGRPLQRSGEAGWRDVGWGLCIHPMLGTGLPLATDGNRVVFYLSPSDVTIVHRTNLIGPVGPWDVEVEEWNYRSNSPAKTNPPAWLDVAKELDARYAYAAAASYANDSEWLEVYQNLRRSEASVGSVETLAQRIHREREGKGPAKERGLSPLQQALALLDQRK